MSRVSVLPYGTVKILLIHLEGHKSNISNTHISTQIKYEQGKVTLSALNDWNGQNARKTWSNNRGKEIRDGKCQHFIKMGFFQTLKSLVELSREKKKIKLKDRRVWGWCEVPDSLDSKKNPTSLNRSQHFRSNFNSIARERPFRLNS